MDWATFTKETVSKLGTPKEPLGLDGMVVIAMLLALAGAWLALEYGIGRLFLRLFRPTRTKPQGQRKRSSDR